MVCGRWALDFGVSDELLGTLVPILVYWAYSGVYVLCGSSENYRPHSRKEENAKNLVSKHTVPLLKACFFNKQFRLLLP